MPGGYNYNYKRSSLETPLDKNGFAQRSNGPASIVFKIKSNIGGKMLVSLFILNETCNLNHSSHFEMLLVNFVCNRTGSIAILGCKICKHLLS